MLSETFGACARAVARLLRCERHCILSESRAMCSESQLRPMDCIGSACGSTCSPFVRKKMGMEIQQIRNRNVGQDEDRGNKCVEGEGGKEKG